MRVYDSKNEQPVNCHPFATSAVCLVISVFATFVEQELYLLYQPVNPTCAHLQRLFIQAVIHQDE
eukprot:m.211334 g.211334  ORF g.211334 m.211334 type:complete len:65 (+) comp15059_c2_seq6:46-240(+)